MRLLFRLSHQRSTPSPPPSSFKFHPVWALAIALMSGVAMGMGTAPVHAWLLPWIAIAPLWVFLHSPGHPERSNLRFNGFLGFAWGVGYHGFALSWITGLHPLTWMGVPWLASLAIALVCWAVITVWGALLVTLWAWIVSACNHIRLPSRKKHSSTSTTHSADLANGMPTRRYRPSPMARVLLGTALWCGLEAVWSSGVLWWTSLSYPQSPFNLAILHLGQISGPQLVTGAIVAVNGCLAEAWIAAAVSRQSGHSPAIISRTARTYAAIGSGLLIGLHLVGFGLYSLPLRDVPDAAFKVGLIQGNIPTRIKLFEQGVRQAFQAYTSGYETLATQGADLVITPEGSLPVFWTPANQLRNPVYQAVLERGVPAILGTFGIQGDRLTQSLFAIDESGDTVSRYNKIKLVPLGEYIPLEEVVGTLINRLSPIEASMVLGDIGQRFDTPFGRAIVGICYESAFPELFRDQAADGGQFILTASNNDPYSRIMMFQHHAQDVMRAVETDRWAARVTNTGYSGIVDPHGHTRWLSGVNTYELHQDTIYRRQTKTLYVRWGDWITPVLLIASLGVWLVGIQRVLREG